MKGKMKGWATRGRPFSEKEFNNSYIKQNSKRLTYKRYLETFAKDYKKKHFRMHLRK